MSTKLILSGIHLKTPFKIHPSDFTQSYKFACSPMCSTTNLLSSDVGGYVQFWVIILPITSNPSLIWYYGIQRDWHINLRLAAV